jgi:hypothetical protein
LPSPAPPTTVATVGQRLYSGSSLSVTLTSVSATGDEVTADVSYQDVGSSAVALTCSGVTVPAIDTLASADGTAIPASRTYCSDNPTATIFLPPGGTLNSYAVFDGVQASSGPFTLTWQENTTISGTVSGITLPPPAPPATVATVARTLYSSSSLSVALTTVSLTGDQVTADVSYQNVGSSAVSLYCSVVSVPAVDTLTSADGTAIPASRTYCSDNPTATIDLPPGGTLNSYAVFDGVQASSGPFTLTWQETTPSGTVSGITLG